MAPHPSMLTVEASTSNRARFIGSSTDHDEVSLHFVVFDFEYFDIGNPEFHIPDPTNPIVFRLWEYLNPEPVYHPNVPKVVFSLDDTPVWLSVQTGRIVDSGEVGFSVSRVDPTNWLAGYTITIHAADGGGVRLADPDDELMFQAPQGEYQHIVRIVQTPGDVYSHEKKLRFYLRTPDKKYAAMHIEVTQFNNGKADLHTGICFNPSGSRNLQYREDLLLRDDKKK